ncbi:MAG: hypothetical protein M3Z46_01780 [Actinomycetota bacterium]|nr:hypothetical protein [Actinomycetota bacterium]
MAVIFIALLVLVGFVVTRGNGRSSGEVRAGAGGPTATVARRGGPSSSAAVTTSTSPTTSTSSTSTVPSTFPTTVTSSTLPGTGDVRTEPPGLLCAMIASRGYDYAAAVLYWQSQGQPPRMDVDGNGRPCETVYPPAAVRAYWHL